MLIGHRRHSEIDRKTVHLMMMFYNYKTLTGTNHKDSSANEVAEVAKVEHALKYYQMPRVPGHLSSSLFRTRSTVDTTI